MFRQKFLSFATLSVLLSSLSPICSGFAADARTKAIAGASLLEQSSQTLTTIADKAMPATLFIKAKIQTAQQEFLNPFDMLGDDVFKRFFGQQFGQLQQPQQPQQQLAAGSGFITSPDGYIVTNNHVIKDASEITVVLNDGREFPAIVKGTDPSTDLAVLKIEAKNLPYLSFGDSDSLKVGELVVAIGNPFGLEGTMTLGIVSGKGRRDLGISTREDYIQTDAAINPGNSGGPLLNLQGEVIGVNTAIITRTTGYMGIGLAIPSKMTQNVIDQIVENGTVKRAFLGIILQPVDKDLSDALNLEKQEGILVSEVMKDSPAAKGGLQQGDIILQYDDKPAKNVSKFRNDVGMMNLGADIKLRILRNNKPQTLTIPLGIQSEGEAVSGELLQKLGLDIDNLSSENAAKLGYSSDISGVMITKVKPGSPAAMTGLRPNFLITGVAVDLNNPKPVKNTSEFENAIKEASDKKHIILIVRQQNFQRYYTIRIN